MTQEELGEHLALDEFAFQFQFDPHTRQQLLEQTDASTILGCFADGQLAAQAQVLPLTAYVAGVPYTMGGIASVATWPEHRRGGKVARLLRRALVEMRAAGQSLSMLSPFSFSFYRKYGWEMLMERRLYTISERWWPRFPDTGGRMERCQDGRRLAPIYEAYARRYTGMLRRTSDWWQQRIAKRKAGVWAVYINAAGEETGYVLYHVKDSLLTVHEWVHLDEDARRGLWNFIANHDSMAREAKLTAPADDTLLYLLDNPRIQHEVEPYFMARIVDVESFLRQYPFRVLGETVGVTLSVADPHADWNQASFHVRVGADGQVGVHRLGEADGVWETVSSAPGGAAVDVDVQDLAAMLLGYRRPRQLAELGRLRAQSAGVEVLEQLIPEQTPYLLDFF